MIKKQLLLILAVTTLGVNTAFRRPINWFMRRKGNVSLSLSSEKYDKVYLVPQETTNGVPIFNEVKTVLICMQLMVYQIN
jgi:hypothetical protein